MKIIVGLGNPGPDYLNARHNAGVMLVDMIYDLRFKNHEYGFRKHKNIYVYESEELVLVKTAGVFMNESGRMIRDFFSTSPVPLSKFLERGTEGERLYLAHDDLDIRLGEYKIQLGKGPREHNGVQSVEQALGTKDFWRVRIGIDNRNTDIDGETYVLQRFTPEERRIVGEAMIRIVEELLK